MRLSILFFTLLALATGCDAQVEPVELRDGESSGSCFEPPPPVEPPSLGACACDPKEPKCGLGLQCLEVEGQFACLAPCFGKNPMGGGYITTCTAHQRELDCISPNGPNGPSYCPACISCSLVDPRSLVCQ